MDAGDFYAQLCLFFLSFGAMAYHSTGKIVTNNLNIQQLMHNTKILLFGFQQCTSFIGKL